VLVLPNGRSRGLWPSPRPMVVPAAYGRRPPCARRPNSSGVAAELQLVSAWLSSQAKAEPPDIRSQPKVTPKLPQVSRPKVVTTCHQLIAISHGGVLPVISDASEPRGLRRSPCGRLRRSDIRKAHAADRSGRPASRKQQCRRNICNHEPKTSLFVLFLFPSILVATVPRHENGNPYTPIDQG
jgi:hypothetical protein